MIEFRIFQGIKLYPDGRVLSEVTDEPRYISRGKVSVGYRKARKQFSVARLIYKFFISEPKSGEQITKIDTTKPPSVDNLKVISAMERGQNLTKIRQQKKK